LSLFVAFVRANHTKHTPATHYFTVLAKFFY
jgi:hypothetical protein